MKKLAVAVLFAAVPYAVAIADDRPPPHPPHRPPQIAFDVCAKAKRGDACSFQHVDFTIEGTCETAPDANVLVCRPNRHPPPPEAIAACDGKSLDDACSFTMHEHAVAGRCERGPDAAMPLACRPDR
jgi:hypothetical protein